MDLTVAFQAREKVTKRRLADEPAERELQWLVFIDLSHHLANLLNQICLSLLELENLILQLQLGLAVIILRATTVICFLLLQISLVLNMQLVDGKLQERHNLASLLAMSQAIGEDFARTVSLEFFQLPCISCAKFLQLLSGCLGVSMGLESLASVAWWNMNFTPMIFRRGCLTYTTVL